RTQTARLQRPACCHYTRADRCASAHHPRFCQPTRGADVPRSCRGPRRHGMMGDVSAENKRVPRARMSAKERREQLLAVSRELFGAKGFDGTSIEEIAARAQVSKPVVYEHFGGKEGIYAVVVDREVEALTHALTRALEAGGHPKILVERTAMALFDYIEANEDGFRVLVRDSPVTQSSGTFSSLIGDVAMQVEHLLGAQFTRRGLDPRYSPIYAQMLVGMVALTGQHWLD